MPATLSTLSFDTRFQGFGHGTLGGYAAGAVAKRIPGPAEVNLRALPPLERELELREAGDGFELWDGDTLVLEAAAAELSIEVPPPPPPEDVARANIRPIHDEAPHPYPGCFCCGPGREEGDALRLFMGRLPNAPERLAAAWTPFRELAPDEDELPPEMLWAALDCPTIWAAWSSEPGPAAPGEGTFTVLARQRLHQHRAIPLGEQVTVTAWPVSREGRKHVTAAAVHDRDGELLARAESLLVEVPRRDP